MALRRAGWRSCSQLARVYGKVEVAACSEASEAENGRLPHADDRETTMQEVLIDGRVLKTPARKAMSLPTKALAMAVAAEWEWQKARRVMPFTMPMTTLVSTAIDQMPSIRERTMQELLNHLLTDTACCRHETDLKLRKKQEEVLDPIVQWMEQHLQQPIKLSHNILENGQDAGTVEAVRRMLLGLSNWELAAVDMIANATKSIVIALAVQKGRLTPMDAFNASRVEENFQMEEWGLVEGGHDLDMADIKVRIEAPSMFLKLLQYQ